MLVQDIITIVYKEWCELRYSTRNLYLLLIVCGGLLALLKLDDFSRSLIPISFFYALLPSLIGMGASGQVIFDSILGEKKAKTLEVLLSTNMSPLAIVAGKIIPAVGVGYFVSQVVLLVLTVFFAGGLPSTSIYTVWLRWVCPFLISYFTCCVSIITTIVVPDEKIAPLISLFCITLPLILVGRIDNVFALLNSNIVLITMGVIGVCCLATWVAALFLERMPLITKL